MSNYITIALASRASKPPKPSVNRLYSTLTSVFIEWQEGTAGEIPILGYKLFMIELATGEVTIVFDGTINSDVKQYSV